MRVCERQRCSARRGEASLVLALCVVFGLTACGGSDRNFGSSSAAGGGQGGTGVAGDQGGAHVGGKPSNSGGEAGEAGGNGEAGGTGEAGAAAATNPGCVDDSLRCSDSTTPSKCVAGSWIDQDPCPAAKPACSNGVCAAATLSGGIVTVADGALSTSSVRLVESGLEYTQTTCGTVGTEEVCVSGGIRP